MSPTLLNRNRPREILALLPLGALCGAIFGVTTNAINGWISPEYFQTIRKGPLPQGSVIWVPSIGQGFSKGALLGAVCGLILMIYIGLVSHLRSPLKFSAKTLFETLALTLSLWVIGGINAILLALFVPQFYDFFIGLPTSIPDTINFAWVQGSMVGAQWGGLLAVCIACARFGARWKRLTKAAESENSDHSK